MYIISGVIAAWLMVITFLSVIRFIGTDYKNKTISDFGKDPKFKRIIAPGCIVIGLLNIPLSVALDKVIRFDISLFFVSVTTSLLIILTGLTVSYSGTWRHQIFSWNFMIFLYLFETMVTYKILDLTPYLGRVMVSILFINLVSAIGLKIWFRKTNGILEISYLGFNSLWLILAGLFLII